MVFKTKERLDKLENRVNVLTKIIDRHENEINISKRVPNIILKDIRKTIDNLIDPEDEK